MAALNPSPRPEFEFSRHANQYAWSRLMIEAGSGDGVAYAELLRDMAAAVKQSVGQVSDSENLICSILLTVHHKRHTWDSSTPIANWLAAVCRHKFDCHVNGHAPPDYQRFRPDQPSQPS